MKKIIAIFLLFLGSLMLIESFQPSLLTYLAPYIHLIKSSLWGVILVFLGIYIILNNKKWRKAIGVVFAIYLALYIVITNSFLI